MGRVIPKFDLLEKLACGLYSLPSKAFNFRTVISTWHLRPDLMNTKHDCGFVACALGWAPVLVPESGLTYFSLEGSSYISSVWDGHSRNWMCSASAAFGLTRAEVLYVFGSSGGLRSSSGPRTVAAHIRRWVKAHRSLYKTRSRC